MLPAIVRVMKRSPSDVKQQKGRVNARPVVARQPGVAISTQMAADTLSMSRGSYQHALLAWLLLSKR